MLCRNVWDTGQKRSMGTHYGRKAEMAPIIVFSSLKTIHFITFILTIKFVNHIILFQIKKCYQVVGGGVAGSAAALTIAHAGFPVTVFTLTSDIRDCTKKVKHAYKLLLKNKK